MCTTSAPVTHVIFDMDGTLVNTEAIVSHVFKTFAQNIDKEEEFTVEIETKLLGHSVKARVQQFIKELELSIDLSEFLNEIAKQLKSYADANGVSLMPGVQKLVDYFDRNNIPMAIASGNTIDSIKRTIVRVNSECFDRFHHIVSGDDEEVIHPKPSPDVFLVAARRFSPIPNSMDEILVFEDNEVGVEAAIAAGMKCVLIPDQRLYNTSKVNSKATVVLKSMHDFRPEMFGL